MGLCLYIVPCTHQYSIIFNSSTVLNILSVLPVCLSLLFFDTILFLFLFFVFFFLPNFPCSLNNIIFSSFQYFYYLMAHIISGLAGICFTVQMNYSSFIHSPISWLLPVFVTYVLSCCKIFCVCLCLCLCLPLLLFHPSSVFASVSVSGVYVI